MKWGAWILSIFGMTILLKGHSEEGNSLLYPAFIHEKLSILSSTDYPSPVISFAAVGDLMLGGSALPVISEKGCDYPFDSTRSILKSVDFAFANLEAPFTLTGDIFKKTFTFRVPPKYAGGVLRAGFDLVTLANNHILDYGPEGLNSTLNVLDSLSIAHCGADSNLEKSERGVILNKGGWRIGFLAYSLTYPSEFWAASDRCGTAYPHIDRLRQTIQTMKSQTDLVVVSFHWGGERMATPKPYQRSYAHQAIDWGADLVIGHHPHVLEGMELYKGRLIAYSLGNFAFGSYSFSAKVSIILKLYFDSKGPLLAEVIPISVFNNDVQFQPRLLKGDKRDQVIHMLNEISADLNVGEEIVGSSGLVMMK